MKKLILFVSILVFGSFSLSFSEVLYGNVKVSKVISVYDGDTFRADILDFPPIIGKKVGIRIYGIDTPEMRGTSLRVKVLAKKAKKLARSKLLNGKEIELRNMRRGKYFRIVAEVWIDGENLAEILKEKGLAKPYFGGKKTKW